MKRLIIILSILLGMSNAIPVFSYELDKKIQNTISDHNEIFEYWDEIGKNPKMDKRKDQEELTFNLLDETYSYGLEQRKRYEKLKNSVSDENSIVHIKVDEAIEENEKIFESLETSINDIYLISDRLQYKEDEDDEEMLINKIITSKFYFSKIIGNSPVETDTIYQKIRKEY